MVPEWSEYEFLPDPEGPHQCNWKSYWIEKENKETEE